MGGAPPIKPNGAKETGCPTWKSETERAKEPSSKCEENWQRKTKWRPGQQKVFGFRLPPDDDREQQELAETAQKWEV
jgi:hypothetical protein